MCIFCLLRKVACILRYMYICICVNMNICICVYLYIYIHGCLSVFVNRTPPGLEI